MTGSESMDVCQTTDEPSEETETIKTEHTIVEIEQRQVNTDFLSRSITHRVCLGKFSRQHQLN